MVTYNSESSPSTEEEPPHPVAGQFPAASTPLTDRAITLYEAFSNGHHRATERQTEAIRALNDHYPKRSRERIMPRSRTSSKQSDKNIEEIVDNTARWDTISSGIWGTAIAGAIGYQVAKHYDVLEPVYTFAANFLR